MKKKDKIVKQAISSTSKLDGKNVVHLNEGVEPTNGNTQSVLITVECLIIRLVLSLAFLELHLSILTSRSIPLSSASGIIGKGTTRW